MMKKKIVVVVFICIFLVSIMISCAENDSIENKPKIQNGLGSGLYISFTVTNGNPDGTFTSHVYSYNLQDEKLENVASVPYTSQYPFTAFDKNENTVYYSYRNANEKNAQLYSYDIDKTSTQRLTEELLGMNFIIPESNRVLVIGIPTYAEIFALYPLCYEKQTGELTNLNWDSDLNIRDVYSDPLTKDLFLSAYSASIYQKRIAEQTDSKPYIQPSTSVFMIDEENNSCDKLFDLADGTTLLSLVRMSNEVVYSTINLHAGASNMNDSESIDDKNIIKFFKYDIANGDTTIYPYGEKLKGFVDFVYLSDDGKYIYFIRKGENSTNELCRYNTSSDTTKIIFSAKVNYEELNNAIILSDG